MIQVMEEAKERKTHRQTNIKRQRCRNRDSKRLEILKDIKYERRNMEEKKEKTKKK